MNTGIMVKLNQNYSGTYQAIVRRVILKPNRMMDHKEALTLDGEWVTVLEGSWYPSECILPVHNQSLSAMGNPPWITDSRIVTEELWQSIMNELTGLKEIVERLEGEHNEQA